VADRPGDIIGRGLGFPLRPSAGQGLALVGGPDKIQQSIWLILSTAPGERRMRPTFGCGVHDLVFSANTSRLRALVTQRVRDALTRWEPRIDVLDVQAVTADGRRELLLVRVDYRMRVNNAVFNLVYPLYLGEGVTR
jgi:phage baseplate assembly protein W